MLLQLRGLAEDSMNALVQADVFFLSVNLSLSGQEIERGGHFEVIVSRSCVETKSARDCFKRTKTCF